MEEKIEENVIEKEADRRKYNPDGHNEYTAPKEKPPRYDLRHRHRCIDDPLDRKDRRKEKMDRTSDDKTALKEFIKGYLKQKSEDLFEVGKEIENEHRNTLEWLLKELGQDPSLKKELINRTIEKIVNDHTNEFKYYYALLPKMEEILKKDS